MKRNIKAGVKIIDNSQNDMLWIKLCKNFFKFKKDLYISGIYISPASSGYTKRTGIDKILFEKLESDIVKFTPDNFVMIMGDINAHVNCNDLDFIRNEESDVMEDSIPANYLIDNSHMLRNTAIHQITNEYGNNLLDICIGSQLRILNGRTIGDTIGKPTFHGYNGSSIDDYCICSADFMNSIRYFKVLDFDVTFSDHCPILVNVQSLYCQHEKTSSQRKSPKHVKWDDNKRTSFLNHINMINKQQFLKRLSEFSNQESVMCNNIDEMVSYFSLTLQQAAHINKAQTSVKFSQKRRKRKKTWYDRDCDLLYRETKHLSRLLGNDPYNINLRQKVYSARKLYNKLIRKKHRQFKGKMLSGLLESEKKNPKEFWNSVNELMEKQKSDPSADISPEKWVDYFKSLMNIDYSDNFTGSSNEDYFKEGLDNTFLNGDISSEEVLKGVKGLKSGKSCGTDEISNEMLQLSVPVLANEFAYLFSHILRNGTYPSM